MIEEFLSYLSLEINRSARTVRAYEADLRGFNNFMISSGVVEADDTGFFVPSAVRPAHIREWMASLHEEGASAVTIRRKVQSLRAFFRFLAKRGVVKSNPASAVVLPRPGRTLPRIAGHDDISDAVNAAPVSLEAIILKLLYGCGLRRSELLAVTDADINLTSGELKILGKGNKHRILPLPSALQADIRAWQSERDSLCPDLPAPRPLLASARGPISSSTLYRIVKRAMGPTNAEKKSPHTLRHSFATQLLNSGADINSVKDLLGHSSLGATQIYTHVAVDEMRRQWQKAHPRAAEADD